MKQKYTQSERLEAMREARQHVARIREVHDLYHALTLSDMADVFESAFTRNETICEEN